MIEGRYEMNLSDAKVRADGLSLAIKSEWLVSFSIESDAVSRRHHEWAGGAKGCRRADCAYDGGYFSGPVYDGSLCSIRYSIGFVVAVC